MTNWVAAGARLASHYVNSVLRPSPFARFNTEAPGPRAALDLFEGRWAHRPDIADDGAFGPEDPLPLGALRAWSPPRGDLAGVNVLELGPLEGAHTRVLEGLGATITAVESNAEAWLKTLVVKELLGLNAKVLFGNFVEYLPTAPDYDLIFASGVLYHMTDPLEVIRLICAKAPRVFVWTHYYIRPFGNPFFELEKDAGYGPVKHYRRNYFARGSGAFWGGVAGHQCWLRRDDLLGAFRQFGHTEIEVLAENPDHPSGPHITFVARR